MGCDEGPAAESNRSSLCWRQAKVAPQTINALVHDEIRDDLTWHKAGAAP
jgi:hypothetical protein